MNLKRTRWMLFGIFILAVVTAIVSWPKGPDLNLKPVGIDAQRQLKIHEGLDLKGGSHLVYEADMSKVKAEERSDALRGTVDVIERRINSLGVSEPVIQSNQAGGSYRVIVELPGVTDVEQASASIGKTVKLEVWEPLAPTDQPAAETDPLTAQGLGNYKRTELSGADLKSASVSFAQQTNEPQISLQFSGDGAKKFGAITKRNVGKPVPITIDAGEPGGGIITSPTVQQEITDGNAIITGSFDIKQAKDLAVQLNSGALPVPVKQVEQRTVGPTLGQDSVEKSLAAGVIGLALVALFMVAFYRLPGVLAVLALLLYTTIMISLFKLIPVTLTLAGIAGFILSIGIAVDANILIFERMKEELRAGKSLPTAVEIGFKRAFLSIRDSNVASILMGCVLYAFGSGTIKGFALVLVLGVVVSFFSAITVTRTLVRLTARTTLGNNLRLWGLHKSEVRDAA